MAQASLDDYLEAEEKEGERVDVADAGKAEARRVEGREEHAEAERVEEDISRNIIADLKDPEHKNRCPYCDEWVGRLHGGAIYLYVRDGRLMALADIDHVYQNCRHGLAENLRFLHKLMAYLKARGYKVFAVGKAYDDDLYAWIHGDGRDLEYQGLRVAVFKAPDTAEDFEGWSYGLQPVKDETIREAIEEILE